MSIYSNDNTGLLNQCNSDIFLEDCDEEDQEARARSTSEVKLNRPQKLILDYKQFKAAVLIQRHVRGWLVRFRKRKADHAVVVIQKWWRRYIAERKLPLLAETKLQLMLVSHLNRCATIIQKVFRGWWSRKYVYDLTKLKSLQTFLAEYIIYTLGTYLHDSKQKAVLPGIRSIQLSRKCMETIEQLMTTFNYRFYNGQACYKMQKTMAEIDSLRKAFKESVEYTNIPFNGFNDRRDCNRRNTPPEVFENNPDSFELIQKFVFGQRETEWKRKIKRHQLPEDEDQKEVKELRKKSGFINRITLDMKNWRHADGNHILPRSLFKNPDNMTALLYGVKAELEDVFGQLEPCICGTLDIPAEFAKT